jgi:hypothetical protein
VFLSYVHEDAAIVGALSAAGFSVCYDQDRAAGCTRGQQEAQGFRGRPL